LLPQQFLEARHAQTGDRLDLAGRLEALLQIEGDRRCVRGTGLHDRPSGAGVSHQRRADECDADPLAEVSRLDDEPMEIDRVAVEPPGDRARENAVDERAEERLSAGLQLGQRLSQRRNLVGTDQIGLDPIGLMLERQQLRGDRRVREIEADELQRRDVRLLSRSR